MVNIAAAYDAVHKDIKVSSGIFEALESSVFERAPTLSATHAIRFVEHLGRTAGPEMIEVCDRIVEANADSLKVHDAFRGLQAFFYAKAQVRPEVTQILIGKVASNFAELSLGHLLDFTDILTKMQNANVISENAIDEFIVSRLD